MVVRAAPRTQPNIDTTAHTSVPIAGDVYVGRHAVVAPGASVRADQPLHIGESSHVQTGAVINGVQQGQVLGKDQRSYSVWIGQNTSITHMAIVHGPAYIGDSCFIGLRSTVLNARIGDGCIVMMHALIQNVEIPPGKFVPSGAVITTQEQADRLPDVQPEDIELASHIAGVNQALRAGVHDQEPIIRHETPSDLQGRNPLSSHSTNTSADTLAQVRQLLRQGYQIGIEFADKRRFRANAWTTGGAIANQNESSAISAIESAMAEHQGHYVRLVGIDPQAKRRVLETVIQRPDGAAVTTSRPQSISAPAASAPSGGSTVAGDVASQVRQLLNQGYKVGTEHADPRRFRANAWMPCAPVNSQRESDVLAALDACIAEHPGDYIRLIGIDAHAKRRVAETIIHRPDANKPVVKNSAAPISRPSAGTASAPPAPVSVSGDVAEQVRQLLSQGYKVGTEHADPRRFRANAWMPCAPVNAQRQAEVMAALEACMAEHPGDYVRLIGIDTQAKRRVAETIIQRPGQKASGGQPTASYTASSRNGYSSKAAAPSSAGLSSDAIAQVRQLLSQGHTIGTEHADKRRFRANAWHSCAPIEARQESAVVSALQSCLNEHAGEYVRLVGIDKKAKRRVLEAVIQRP